jgi:hypothetical protein
MTDYIQQHAQALKLKRQRTPQRLGSLVLTPTVHHWAVWQWTLMWKMLGNIEEYMNMMGTYKK